MQGHGSKPNPDRRKYMTMPWVYVAGNGNLTQNKDHSLNSFSFELSKLWRTQYASEMSRERRFLSVPALLMLNRKKPVASCLPRHFVYARMYCTQNEYTTFSVYRYCKLCELAARNLMLTTKAQHLWRGKKWEDTAFMDHRSYWQAKEKNGKCCHFMVQQFAMLFTFFVNQP